MFFSATSPFSALNTGRVLHRSRSETFEHYQSVIFRMDALLLLRNRQHESSWRHQWWSMFIHEFFIPHLYLAAPTKVISWNLVMMFGDWATRRWKRVMFSHLHTVHKCHKQTVRQHCCGAAVLPWKTSITCHLLKLDAVSNLHNTITIQHNSHHYH